MPAAKLQVALKRVYREPSKADGRRVLVDRLWPRGLKKQDAKIDAWLRDLAPSDELRQWFHGHRDHWGEFRRRYLRELRGSAAAKALDELYGCMAGAERLTLLFASKDEEHNNAAVLKELIEGMKKPPTGTQAAAQRVRLRRRAPG